MKENWPRALSFNLAWEGGAAKRREEPGGAVNKGISLLAYREWRKKHNRPPPTISDLNNITDDEVSRFYKERADQIGFDSLPSGYDLALFNASTMFGVEGARKLHAIAKGDIGYLMILQAEDKLKAASVVKFGKGWGARFRATYEVAKELEGKQW